ncbi:MAG: hypothetical protein Q7J20_03830 [Candidatus Nitrotoga sp.]|nr:hypothetical protein [Candidatus Nitrotoga sp.]MDO9447024.1 hypothetical protein [Candidatus Nitrotoga sp.]MDP3496900.1 hypothetical protein [Candidatus Nitrotoga sp.]
MRQHQYLILFASIALATPSVAQSRTITDFESSTFYKKETLISKDPAYDLRTGGKNNSYFFKDTENTYSSIGVELTTKGQDIVEVGIHWNGQSTLRPAKMAPKKIEQLKDLAAFWGVPGQAKAIVDYAKSQQSKHYSGGSSQAPRKSLGPISIHCGTTGETLWVGWIALTVAPPALSQSASDNAKKPSTVVVGTLADTVLGFRGKAMSKRQVGSDGNGLLVEWEYPDATYLMSRQVQDDVEAYRVIKIKSRK